MVIFAANQLQTYSRVILRMVAALILLPALPGITAEVQLVPGQVSFEFGGERRAVAIQFRNSSTNEDAIGRLRYRLYQSSSGAAAPVAPAVDWKSISVGPGQAVTEEVSCAIPKVRAGSTFHLVWYDGERKLGATVIWVYPSGLLQSLTNSVAVGVVDPGRRLTNELASVGYHLLREAEEISGFDGKLIVVAPTPAAEVPADLGGALKRCANSGAGVVWFQAAGPGGIEPGLSAYVLEQGEGRMVVAHESLSKNLTASPLSQLRLIELTDLALGRKKLGWPGDAQSSLLTQDSTIKEK